MITQLDGSCSSRHTFRTATFSSSGHLRAARKKLNTQVVVGVGASYFDLK
jgi:hypothetical protein